MTGNYSFFRFACLTCMLLVIAFFVCILYELRGDAYSRIELWSMLILSAGSAVYLANCYQGLALVRRYRSGEGISRNQQQLIIILWIMLLLLQIYIAWVIPGEIRLFFRLLDNSFNSPYADWNDHFQLFMQALPTLIFFVTLIMQILTFPLVSAVKKKHLALVTSLDELGRT